MKKSIAVEKFEKNIEKKHSQKFGGFKEMVDKKTRIECLNRSLFHITGYDKDFESKVLHEYSLSSQQLPVLDRDGFDGFTITFRDLHNLPDRSDNSIDLLAIKHSTFDLPMNYYIQTSYSVDEIGKNRDQEFLSLTNRKIDKRNNRFESNIRYIKKGKFSMLINEVFIFNP